MSPLPEPESPDVELPDDELSGDEVSAGARGVRRRARGRRGVRGGAVRRGGRRRGVGRWRGLGLRRRGSRGGLRGGRGGGRWRRDDDHRPAGGGGERRVGVRPGRRAGRDAEAEHQQGGDAGHATRGQRPRGRPTCGGGGRRRHRLGRSVRRPCPARARAGPAAAARGARRSSGSSAGRPRAAPRTPRRARPGVRAPGRGGRWRAWRSARGGAGAGILAARDTASCEPLVTARRRRTVLSRHFHRAPTSGSHLVTCTRRDCRRHWPGESDVPRLISL